MKSSIFRTFKLFITLIVMGTVLNLPADVKPGELPAQFYKHFTGSINGKYEIVVHLQRGDDSLYGYYYYKNRGIVLFLEGKIRENGDFSLEEHERANSEAGLGSLSGTFEGKFVSAAAVRGTWRSPDKKKNFPFEAMEDCGRDSMCFQFYRLEDHTPLFPDRTQGPGVNMNLTLAYPSRFGEVKTLATLQNAVSTLFPADPEKHLSSIRDDYVKVYRETNQEIYDPEQDWMFMWEYSESFSVVCNDHDLLTLRYSLYEYTGGAHGNSYISFRVFDLKSGTSLELTDVFFVDRKAELAERIDKELRERDNIPPGANLSDHGYFVDELPVPDNFYIAPDGIGFFYNNYEIRAFAFGPVEVFLPYAKIKDLIRPDSPVRRLSD